MADYYPLIARAVAGLENSTGESRRALYERARTALVAQLRGVEPALSEQDITRERLSLEEAIRKVESDAARRASRPQAKPEIKPAPASSERPRRGDALRGAVQGSGEPPRARDNPPRESSRTARPALEDAPAPRMPRAGTDFSSQPAQPQRPRRDQGGRPSLGDQGMRGFRDVVADVNDLGRAASNATRSARRTYAEVPSPSGEFDRFEPSLEPSYQEPFQNTGGYTREEALAEAERHRLGTRPTAPQPQAAQKQKRKGFPLRTLLLIVGLVLLGIGAAFVVTSQWSSIAKMFASSTTQPPKKPALPAKDTAQPAQPKITDRVGQPGTEAVAPVAQRAIIYEEDPADPKGKQSAGSVVWRLENVPVAAGKPPETAVRADIEFPERNIKINLSLRRNSDPSLPASHTAELSFTLPPDFSGGGIANVPGILMKSAEQTRGTPLAGLAVKVTDGFFLIGLSNVDADRARNIQTLKERGWIDIPIVYTNQRRAILVIEKGAPGERIFNDAFAAWGQ